MFEPPPAAAPPPAPPVLAAPSARDVPVVAGAEVFVRCQADHRHWGRFGAAGLAVVAPAVPPGGTRSGAGGGPLLLMQERALWSHHGGTWALPGGARHADETPADAALREAAEEVALRWAGVDVRGELTDDHGGWSYVTVLATLPAAHPPAPASAESATVCWVPLAEVTARPLHPDFARTWPTVRAALLPLLG